MARSAALATILSIAAVLGPPATVAHEGNRCGLAGDATRPVLEGECYRSGDPDCDPDFDGEHIEVRNAPWASGGAAAWLPHSGCGVEFDPIMFEAPITFDAFRVMARGNLGREVAGEVRVVVDGEIVARGAFFQPGDGPAQDGTFDAPVSVLPGSHTVRIEWSVTVGASYSNLFVDMIAGRSAVQTCAGGVCGTVILETKIADLGAVDARQAAMATVTVETGRLRIDAAGTFAEQLVVLARLDGAPDHSVLEQDLGIASTSFAPTAEPFRAAMGADVSETKIGELWSARLQIFAAREKVSDLPILVAVPTSVPDP